MQASGSLWWAGLIAVGMHGLGMIGGVYFAFATSGWLAAALGGRGTILAVVRVAVAVLWLVSGILLVGAAWAFFKDLGWWRQWAMLGAPLSFAAIVLWAGGKLPPGAYAGAAFDVLILGYALASR